MKLARLVWFAGTACMPQLAAAGGLFLPGAGAISTSRAGAGVASADDGEAISLNPAGIAKATGNTITISAAMLSYAMQFQRRGTYDTVAREDYAYAGQPYALEKNDARPPLGFGSVQPVPVIAFITDLGGKVAGLHLGIGLYAPNAYPFRDMCTETANGCQKYVFNSDFAAAPPGARYDIMKQEAAIILPSLAVAYSVNPQLDIGVRISAGQASLKSTTALWASPGPNYSENVKADGVFTIDAKDSFVPAFGLGVTWRPTPNLELGASYASKLDIHAKGTARAQLGPSAGVAGIPTSIVPVSDTDARCATGGNAIDLKACVDLELPMSAQLGGRYKFLDHDGNLRGDVELDVDWENWGKTCSADDFETGSCTDPSDYRVVVDAQAQVGAGGLPLQTSAVRHGLQDTYGVRLGGSYHIALGPQAAAGAGVVAGNEVIVRGGVGYDTASAKDGWLRADLDGAARTTLALGAAYRTHRFEIDAGAGVALEGSPNNPNVGGGAEPCNPTDAAPTCAGSRQGPDPINPLIDASKQAQNPISQGAFQSHYLMFMLGASTWF